MALSSRLVSSLPASLNGFPVVDWWRARDGESLVVLVDRGSSSPHRYVVARWWPDLGLAGSWHQGDYFGEAELGEARHRAEMRARS